jgi:hypothetical protein
MILTSFPFCCLQVCRLSFLLYVIKLRFATGSRMGGGLAKKLKNARSNSKLRGRLSDN